ncbi:hypothetical protein [Kutzneria sp. NPDC052558]|uniref:hypothetical protein n=1 Tax=Kutzneria sp. NPDC052558 TaxID=3364121 RepID=UPI0037C54516
MAATVGHAYLKLMPSVEGLLEDLRNKIRQAQDQSPTLIVPARVDIAEIHNALREAQDSAPPITVGTKVSAAQLRRSVAEAAKENGGLEVPLTVEADTLKAKEDIERTRREEDGKSVRLDVTVAGGLAAAVRALSEVSGAADRTGISFATMTLSVGASVLRYGAMVAAVGQAIQVLGGLGAAAGTASGALLLVPAAGLAAASAVVTLKVGLQGFADAVTESDPTKLAADLAALAPAARSTVVAVRELQPAFVGLRLDVQQTLFRGLSTEVASLGRQYVPVLRSGLDGVAGSLNTTATGLAGFLASARTSGDLSTVFTNTAAAVRILGGAVVPIGTALRDVAAVGATFLPQLAQLATNLATRFGAFVDQARQSGQLSTWIGNALGVIGQLIDLVRNLAGILGSVFSALQQAGTTSLGVLVSLTGNVRAFLDSAAGNTALLQIFGGLNAAAAGLGPVLDALGRTVVTTIAPAISALGPQIRDALTLAANGFAPLGGILAAVAPLLGTAAQATASVLVPALSAVQPVVAALVPPLQAVAELLGATLANAIAGSLGPGLLALAQAAAPLIGQFGTILVNALSLAAQWFGQLAGQVAGLLPAFGGALLSVLSSALQAFSALGGAVGTVLLATLQALQPTLPVITTAVGQLAGVIGGALAAATPTLVQVGQQLAAAAGVILSGLLPLVPQLADALLGLVTATLGLLPPLLQLVSALLPGAVQLVAALAPVVVQAAGVLTALVQAATPFVAVLADELSPTLEALGRIVADVFSAMSAIISGALEIIKGVIHLFLALVTGDWSGAWRALGEIVHGIVSQLTGVISAGLDIVLNIIKGLGPLILNAASGFLGVLVQPGRDIINGLVKGIEAGFQWVKDKLKQLTDWIAQWKGPPARDAILLQANGRLIMRGLVDGFDRGLPEVRDYLQDLTATIPVDVTTGQRGRPAVTSTPSATTGFGTSSTVDGSGAIAGAVTAGVLAALDGARMRVDGAGVARLVNDVNARNARR